MLSVLLLILSMILLVALLVGTASSTYWIFVGEMSIVLEVLLLSVQSVLSEVLLLSTVLNCWR